MESLLASPELLSGERNLLKLLAMPLRNRVDPFGIIQPDPGRGTLTGNRGGALHDADRHIRRPFAGDRWILCRLQFKGRRRPLMTPGRYTELFFLDEATGLAAGHRPCAECRRNRYSLFQRYWAAGNPGLAGSPTPSAGVMDAALHADRLDGRGRRSQQRTHVSALGALPAGVMVVLPGDEIPMLVTPGGLRPWSFAGYGPPVVTPADTRVTVLTPSSVVRAVAAGFTPELHPSAAG